MTYQYECDGFCDADPVDERPALTAEFSEQFIKATAEGGYVTDAGYSEGDLITLCPECTVRLLVDL